MTSIASSTPVSAGSAIDERFMELALILGRRGLGRTWPNPAVGAVIVQFEGDKPVIVGRGITEPGGRPHAETEAIRPAGNRAKGATLYVTLEPCSHHGRTPPCADAIIAAGIARVVSAVEDPNPEVAGQGHARLRAAGISVDVGVGAAEARRAHAGHFRRVRDGRPHVFLKLAVSADGKVALAGRRPVAISGEAARARVHMMRAQHDAIMIGVGTALADDPLLTCRLPGMAARSPVRIVLDTDLRVPVQSALVTSARDVPLWVIAGPEAAVANEAALQNNGVTVLHTGRLGDGVNIAQALTIMAQRGITRLMVEGGPTVAAALLNAGLVDEVALVMSDKLIGADGIDAIAGLSLSAITQSPRFRLHDNERAGNDRIEIYERA